MICIECLVLFQSTKSLLTIELTEAGLNWDDWFRHVFKNISNIIQKDMVQEYLNSEKI